MFIFKYVPQSNVLENNAIIKTAPNSKRSIRKGQYETGLHKTQHVKMARGHRGDLPERVDDHKPRFKS